MDQLVQAYRSKRLILFVGAGVSMTLGLPSWRQLVDHMARELGFDPDIYRTFGSDLTLAEFYRVTKGQIGPLRSWMDREWHSSSTDISRSRVHELIAKADFDLIYTTNYDRWLERALDHYRKPYSKIASVGDLSLIAKDKTQIVKFHGDFDDDTSIVLDETSYFERLEFESPLDIKFRSDVLGRSVLFIGYSLSDINIRYLFYRLANLWKKSSRGVPQPMSFVFSARPNAVQEAVLAQWNIKMISSQGDDPEKALIGLLEQLC
jgi:hypothetical protein